MNVGTVVLSANQYIYFKVLPYLMFLHLSYFPYLALNFNDLKWLISVLTFTGLCSYMPIF
jgi:hypothetical protein